MNLILNNQNITSESAIIKDVLELEKIPLVGIAVAVNEVIIPRSDWESHKLNENDNLLVITATQGG